MSENLYGNVPRPLVSIIIPCFNAEKYVSQAIQSALDQTYRPIEVIVIDDGSTDHSLSVIKSFGDKVRWVTGPNRGGSASRNVGIGMAQGELIQFLDADDLLLPDKLQRQVRIALCQPASLVYCQYHLSMESGAALYTSRAPKYNGEDPVVFAVRAKGLQTSSPLHWRRNLEAVNGFREELPCAQERDLHLRLACAGLGFFYMPDVLYSIRRIEGSVSSNSVRVLDQHRDIVANAYRMLEALGQLSDQRKAAFAGLLASDARAYLRHGLVQKASDYFEQASKLHPNGGIPEAYGPITRWFYHLLGPQTTQKLVALKRSAYRQ